MAVSQHCQCTCTVTYTHMHKYTHIHTQAHTQNPSKYCYGELSMVSSVININMYTPHPCQVVRHHMFIGKIIL